jgi:hypothetical protein
MLTVACVLRTGQRVVDKLPYGVEHVVKLRNGVKSNLGQTHRFVCLTDMVAEVEAAGIEAIRLPTDWHGWWSKINLFTPNLLTGSVLYLDLDSLVTGPLDPLVRDSEGITMVSDFTRPEMMNSSAMAWIGDYSAIWHTFAQNFDAISRQYDRIAGPRIGDQGFIHDTLRNSKIDTFHPEHVVSFKRSARSGPPADARVISFHGTPKLDSPDAGWAYDAWSAL